MSIHLSNTVFIYHRYIFFSYTKRNHAEMFVYSLSGYAQKRIKTGRNRSKIRDCIYNGLSSGKGNQVEKLIHSNCRRCRHHFRNRGLCRFRWNRLWPRRTRRLCEQLLRQTGNFFCRRRIQCRHLYPKYALFCFQLQTLHGGRLQRIFRSRCIFQRPTSA